MPLLSLGADMRRREFLGVSGRRGPVAARGAGAAGGRAGDRLPPQRVVEVVGAPRYRIPAGLKEAGFVEGQNVAIEYH